MDVNKVVHPEMKLGIVKVSVIQALEPEGSGESTMELRNGCALVADNVMEQSRTRC
jgi:hypothetical protein